MHQTCVPRVIQHKKHGIMTCSEGVVSINKWLQWCSRCLSLFELSGFHTQKKRTLWSLTLSFHQNLNNFTCQFNTQGPPQPQLRLQSSGWWYTPESKCVHILSLVLLGKMLEQCVIASRPRSQAKYVGKASFANLCSCCCQQHHGQRHPPGTLLASVVSRSCGFPVEMW